MNLEPSADQAARKPRILLWGMVAAALVLLLLGVGIATWSVQQNAAVGQQWEAVSDSGLPSTAAELELYYVAPAAGEDMTQLWLDGCAPLALPEFAQAAGKMPLVGAGEEEIPPPGEPWDGLPAAEQLLKSYQSSLALLHQAADGGGAARFPTSFKTGFAMPLKHSQDSRTASRLLILEAHVRAHRGDARGAAQSLLAAFQVGESLKNEPIIISQLVRMACDASARKHLTQLLPHVAFPDDDLVAFQNHLATIEYRSGLQRALAGERVLGSMAIDDPRMLGGMVPTGVDVVWPLVRGGAQQVYLDFMQQALDAAGSPWPQALAKAQQAEAKLEADQQAASELGRMKYLITGLVASSLTGAFNAACRNTAGNQASLTAVAIERYRREHGELPGALADLTPKWLPRLPIDPFDGRPLRYLPSEEEYVVYHIGEDGIDNGGQGDETEKPDGVLRVPLPTAANKPQ